MKTALKFAMGAALAGTLVNMLMKRRSGNDSMGEKREDDAILGEELPQSPPMESIRDSAGTPASAIPVANAPQNLQGF